MVDERVIQAKKQAIERDLIIENSKRAQIVSDWFDNLQKRKSFQNALERTQPIDYNQITQITDSSEQRSEQQIASTLMTKLISLIGNPRISHQIINSLSPDESMILNDKFDSFKTSWNTSKRSKIEFETLLAEIKLFCRPYVNALRGINTSGSGLGGLGGGGGGLSRSFSFGSDDGLTSFPKGMTSMPFAPSDGNFSNRSLNLDDFEQSLSNDDSDFDSEGFKKSYLKIQSALLNSRNNDLEVATQNTINEFYQSCITAGYLGREFRNETDISSLMLTDLLNMMGTSDDVSPLIELYEKLATLAETDENILNTFHQSSDTKSVASSQHSHLSASAASHHSSLGSVHSNDNSLGEIKDLDLTKRLSLASKVSNIIREKDKPDYEKRLNIIIEEINNTRKTFNNGRKKKDRVSLIHGNKKNLNREDIEKLSSDELNFFLLKITDKPSDKIKEYIRENLNVEQYPTRDAEILRALFSKNKLVKKLSTPTSPIPSEQTSKIKRTGNGINDCKYFVDQNMLDKNKLCIKYKSTNNYKMKPIDISTDLSNVVKDILDDRFSHTNRDYNRLNQKEKQILSLFIQKMKLESNVKLPDNELAKMYNQWIILKDERSAGNDSVEVKNKLRQMTLTMLEIGKVSKSTAYNLLYELSL
jgi:hypothetical protein